MDKTGANNAGDEQAAESKAGKPLQPDPADDGPSILKALHVDSRSESFDGGRARWFTTLLCVVDSFPNDIPHRRLTDCLLLSVYRHMYGVDTLGWPEWAILCDRGRWGIASPQETVRDILEALPRPALPNDASR